MSDSAIVSSQVDQVLPFRLEASNLRGRLVRLEESLDTILKRHAYPSPVAALLGEALILAVLLAGMLKYEGVFTFQIKGNGPLSLLVVDVTSKGTLRGYAQYDVETLEKVTQEDGPVPSLLGEGYLAFTVDQGEHTDRYQGIVSLNGKTLVDCVQHYFHQSEQLETGLMISIKQDTDRWRGAGVMLQRLPLEGAGRPVEPPPHIEDAWRHAMVLLSTCTSEELLDFNSLPAHLLYRLFHEDGVRVYPGHPLRFECRCSRARVEGMLRSFSADDLKDMIVEGKIQVKCEFCNAAYNFNKEETKELFVPKSTEEIRE